MTVSAPGMLPLLVPFTEDLINYVGRKSYELGRRGHINLVVELPADQLEHICPPCFVHFRHPDLLSMNLCRSFSAFGRFHVPEGMNTRRDFSWLLASSAFAIAIRVRLRIEARAETLLANKFRGALRISAKKKRDKLNWKKPGIQNAGPGGKKEEEDEEKTIMDDEMIFY